MNKIKSILFLTLLIVSSHLQAMGAPNFLRHLSINKEIAPALLWSGASIGFWSILGRSALNQVPKTGASKVVIPELVKEAVEVVTIQESTPKTAYKVGAFLFGGASIIMGIVAMSEFANSYFALHKAQREAFRHNSKIAAQPSVLFGIAAAGLLYLDSKMQKI